MSQDKEFYYNNILNYIFKISSILLGLININLALQYLGNFNYGIWVTISSIASWAAIGDLGIGNGLRNELAKAYANNDQRKQDALIVSSLFYMCRIAIFIFILLSIVCEILIYCGFFLTDIRLAIYTTNLFMCINFILGISKSIAYAYQKSWMASLSQSTLFIFDIILITMLLSFDKTNKILWYALIDGVAGILANILLFYQIHQKTNFSLNINLYDKNILTSVASLGIQFFVLQLCCLILYSTDSLIINTLIGSESVTNYSIITKVYNTGDNLFAVALISMWSAVTYQWEKKNFQWIVSKIKILLLLWIIYSFGVIVVSLFFNDIVYLWLKTDSIKFNNDIIFLFAVFNILNAFGAIFVNIANGIGNIKLQMYIGIFSAIINIPLSIYFIKAYSLGIFGVKLATLMCCFGSFFVIPIQIFFLLKSKLKEMN